MWLLTSDIYGRWCGETVTAVNGKARCFILCEKKQGWICSSASASTSLKFIIMWDSECDQCAWVNILIMLCSCRLLFTQYKTTWLVRNSLLPWKACGNTSWSLTLSSDFWARTKRKIMFSASSFHNSSAQFLCLRGVLILVSYLKLSDSRIQGRTQGGLVGLNPPPFRLIFYKILLPAQRRLIVFAYFLLVNLST